MDAELLNPLAFKWSFPLSICDLKTQLCSYQDCFAWKSSDNGLSPASIRHCHDHAPNLSIKPADPAIPQLPPIGSVISEYAWPNGSKGLDQNGQRNSVLISLVVAS
ncbi:MAG: hypothetical protein ACLPKB_35030 [Xanthobacteraceae bacterium]